MSGGGLRFVPAIVQDIRGRGWGPPPLVVDGPRRRLSRRSILQVREILRDGRGHGFRSEIRNSTGRATTSSWRNRREFVCRRFRPNGARCGSVEVVSTAEADCRKSLARSTTEVERHITASNEFIRKLPHRCTNATAPKLAPGHYARLASDLRRRKYHGVAKFAPAQLASTPPALQKLSATKTDSPSQAASRTGRFSRVLCRNRHHPHRSK
jgi:hypothetical protein